MELYIAIAAEWIVCLVVVILIVRAVRRDEARGEARLREVEAAAQARVAAAQAALKRSVVLRVTLDLRDSDAVADVARVARDAERLIAGLSDYETSIGGRGLILTAAKAAPGQVILTLTPKDTTDAGSRVEQVADILNAAFDSTIPTHEPAPNLGSLPGDVSGAHAVLLAA